MSRTRVLILAAVLVVFAAIGGVLIVSGGHGGGQNVTFNVAVTGATKMSPSTLSAHQNDSVTINITSDTTGEVHLHGYDIAFSTRAGEAVTHTFKATTTCSCAIEWESTGAPLGTLQVSP
ncbi:MAG TPA: hypothetical protein VLU92_10560 [Candidatus Dormibacteraeota bacterium]|nr:hypothetical protein [Candidatus Dormibacteraeota bacterium]